MSVLSDDCKSWYASPTDASSTAHIPQIDDNSTLPVTIGSISVSGTRYTRKGFLARVLQPAIDSSKDGTQTLSGVMEELQRTTNQLHKFGIFHPSINMYLDKHPSPAGHPTALSVLLSVQERSRMTLKAGSDFGHNGADAYVNGTLRNLFGGAESLNASFSSGSHTRGATEVTFSTPLLANPDQTLHISGFSIVSKPYYSAPYTESQHGGKAAYRFLSRLGDHELAYTGVWRQIGDIQDSASPSIRNDAGSTVKSALSHTFLRERRDDTMLPTSGYYLKAVSELAGTQLLGGDVGFFKNEVEAQQAFSLPFGASFTAGFRAGAMTPVSLDGNKPAAPSRINDRFLLGGPTDVRGFREAGIGPRDGADAVGGDVFVAGGASLLLPLPRVGAEKPIRLQAWVNGGRMVGIQRATGMRGAFREVGNGWPSVAAGLGLVYSASVARVELNVGVPLVLRQGEQGRKGVQFGVGMSFL